MLILLPLLLSLIFPAVEHDFLLGAAETENAFKVELPLHLMLDWGTVDTTVTHYCILKKVHSVGLL